MADALDDWHRPVNKNIRGPIAVGIVLLALLVGGFGVWAATAPLASAVVAHGVFVATGSNKIVQHLEGGIIRAIAVKEGERVEAGATLVVLDDTAAKSDLRRLEIRRATLLVTRSRLDAERVLAVTVDYDKALLALATSDAEVAGAISAQNAVFEARRAEFAGQQAINLSRIGAIEQEKTGLAAQKASAEEQLRLIRQETAAAETLYLKGLTDRPRLLALQRSQAKLGGDIGQYTSEIGRADQRILEARSAIAHERSKIVEEGADLYRQVAAELSDTDARLGAQRDVMRRLAITAPVRGIIVKLHYHTAGGVVTPGQPVLEMLPTDDKLLVEAYVAPQDVDNVRIGLEAELKLTALNQRTAPLVLGTVVYRSADKIEQKRDGSFYYLARIEIDGASLARLGKTELTPGMPAEVYIRTGERTFAEYLVQPILDVIKRGGRER